MSENEGEVRVEFRGIFRVFSPNIMCFSFALCGYAFWTLLGRTKVVGMMRFFPCQRARACLGRVKNHKHEYFLGSSPDESPRTLDPMYSGIKNVYGINSHGIRICICVYAIKHIDLPSTPVSVLMALNYEHHIQRSTNTEQKIIQKEFPI